MDFVKVSSTDGQRWCCLSCTTVVLGVKRGLMFLEGCVGLVKYFSSSSYTSHTTDCKGGPRSTYTFYLRTEMSWCQDDVLFILKGSYSNHG
jgi:hypothetical protein